MNAPLNLALELTTFAFFVVMIVHAWRLRGRSGLGFLGALLVLGFVRENFVLLRDILYGYGDLLQLGSAPLLGVVIWAFSLYAAVCWSETMTGEQLESTRPSAVFLLSMAVFMLALVGFYEPFLAHVDIARWHEGTRKSLGVPWIACLGYPSLTVPFVVFWCRLEELKSAWCRWGLLTLTVPALAIAHAWGLAALKDLLGW